MVDEREIQQMIDACRDDGAGRPDAADLADPALSPLVEQLARDPGVRAQFERAKKWDAEIREALVDVPVPPGLADRIVDRLAAAASSPAAETSSPDYGDAAAQAIPICAGAVERKIGRNVDARWRGRRWVVAAGLAAAAALFVAVTLFRPADRISPEQLLEAVRQFDAEAQPEAGSLLAATPAPSAYPLSSRIVSSPATTWTHVAGLLGRRGVAYELHAPGGARATLYVVKLAGLPNDPRIAADRLPSAPPGRPQPASGGAAMAAWQEKGRLYVLVVHGDDRAYQRFIRPAQPIA